MTQLGSGMSDASRVLLKILVLTQGKGVLARRRDPQIDRVSFCEMVGIVVLVWQPHRRTVSEYLETPWKVPRLSDLIQIISGGLPTGCPASILPILKSFSPSKSFARAVIKCEKLSSL